MSLALGVIVLLAAFAACAWSGRTLAEHYQDRWEVASALAVGACLFAALGVMGHVRDAPPGWPEAGLGLAMAAGLFSAYVRAGDRRRV
jgi:hypothetical protein